VGGSTSTGGAPVSGGATSGGSTGTGGISLTGGSIGIGGSTNTGGSVATGGSVGFGGSIGTGGSIGIGGSSVGTGGSSTVGDLPLFSFFVTSLEALRRLSGNQNGFGGDLRYGEADGLTGADKICTEIAESSMEGAGQKVWRAFLSTSTVDAIDRVGQGPWYDRLGRTLAMTVSDLLNTRPNGADPAIIDDLPNEYGVPNSNPDGTGAVDNHHMLTGSNENGRLRSTNPVDTCNDWTSAVGSTGQPQCGMSFPRGGGGGMAGGGHWISAFTAYGCAPGVSLSQDGGGDRSNPTVGEGGGYGGFYCFALTP
jgi:hypothetical protein